MNPNAKLTLLLGGARSGKSSYAERWAAQHGDRVLFVATAQDFGDEEMADRIAAHRASRPSHWHTLEVPLNAGPAINAELANHPYDTVVVDCMTLLASNALLTLPEDATDATPVVVEEAKALIAAQRASTARWLIVTNEVGMGIVPPSRLGRLYRDALGRANQVLAEAADEVLLFVAGLPWQLKPVPR